MRASPSSSGRWAASDWTSIFFEEPCGPWSGRQCKANPYPHRRSHRSHDAGSSRFTRRCTALVQARRPAARTLYYWHLAGRDDETGDCELRNLIQRICLKDRFCGYRRVTATLRRQGVVVNAKKVQRLMREDNCWPSARRRSWPPADRPSAFLIVPNLVRGLVPSAPDQIWVADTTYVHLAKSLRLFRSHS